MANKWRWEISPHPYSCDFDAFVTNDDEQARDAIAYAVEMHLWDQHEGGNRQISVVFNTEVSEVKDTQ